jgi:hypothetical protein
MRPFSKKSGGALYFIDKNCLQEKAGQNISLRLLPTAESRKLRQT